MSNVLVAFSPEPSGCWSCLGPAVSPPSCCRSACGLVVPVGGVGRRYESFGKVRWPVLLSPPPPPPSDMFLFSAESSGVKIADRRYLKTLLYVRK